MTIYATYFDSKFLLRGLACIESLTNQSVRPPRVLVLALDEACQKLLPSFATKLFPQCDLTVLSLAELEASCPELAHVKGSRSAVEYIFTLTPALCLDGLRRAKEGEHIIYLDADMYFFGDPDRALQDLGENSIGITEHRFPARKQHLSNIYGKFNVGWVAFRNDETARTCARDWLHECLTSCSLEPTATTFGDQKYLDTWPARYPRVSRIANLGVNAGPWNVPGHTFEDGPDGPLIDGSQLIVFHFHRVNRVADGLYETDYLDYGRMSPSLCDTVYVPYVRALVRLEHELHDRLPRSAFERLAKFKRPGLSPKGLLRYVWTFVRLCLRRRVVFNSRGPISAIGGLRYV